MDFTAARRFVLARLLTVPFTLYCVYLTWATWTAPIPASNPAASWSEALARRLDAIGS